MSHHLAHLSLCLLVALLAPPDVDAQAPVSADADDSAAPEPDADNPASRLDPVTVIGTLGAEATLDRADSAVALDAVEINRRQARDLKDALRYLPGVSVSQASGRFAIGDVRIRGMGGNRVEQQVDGVSLSDSFAIGSFSNAGRDFVDPALLERIEVYRGSASALYGSDAIGGVVTYATRDPDDLLTNEPFTVSTRVYGNTDDHSNGASSWWAGQSGKWSVLIQANQLAGHERDNQGKNDNPDRSRTRPNPQDMRRQGLLAKFVHQDDEGTRLALIVDRAALETDTDVLSQQGQQSVFGQTILTQSMVAADEQHRHRVSAEWTASPDSWVDDWTMRAYHQTSQTEQETIEQRATLIGGTLQNPTRRDRLFRFDQRVSGLDLLGKREAKWGNADHHWTIGASIQQGGIAGLRDGSSTNLTTGATSTTIFPDVFPVRDFPKSDTQEWGIFLQDQMQIADGRLQLTPALRYDHYALDPVNDPIFADDNPGITPVALDHAQWSPRLGALWHLDTRWSAYLQIAAGFRAPPYNDVNFGFTNLQSGYTAIPNPNLKPESSLGQEIGIKWVGDGAQLSLALFDNHYDDFIESLSPQGMDPGSGLLVFQSQNIDEVRIRGLEWQGTWFLDAVGAPGWALQASAAYAHGQDLADNVPLNSVDPLRGVVGLQYDRGGAQIEVLSNLAARKRRVAPIDSIGTDAFAAPGHATLDVYASVPVGKALIISVAATNLTDRHYWDWADLPALAANSSILDRFTRPGRGFRMTLDYTF